MRIAEYGIDRCRNPTAPPGATRAGRFRFFPVPGRMNEKGFSFEPLPAPRRANEKGFSFEPFDPTGLPLAAWAPAAGAWEPPLTCGFQATSFLENTPCLARPRLRPIRTVTVRRTNSLPCLRHGLHRVAVSGIMYEVPRAQCHTCVALVTENCPSRRRRADAPLARSSSMSVVDWSGE